MREILWGLGFAACHQLASHSVCPGGEQIPWCARCMGIYLGAFISIVTLLLPPRWASGRPHPAIVIILGLGTILLALDAGTDLVGWRHATTLTRTATGLWMGLSLPPILWSILIHQSRKDQSIPIIGWSWMVAVFASAGLVLALVLANPDWAWWYLATGTGLGQLGLWGIVNLAIAVMLINDANMKWLWRWVLTIVLLLLELLFLGALHLLFWQISIN